MSDVQAAREGLPPALPRSSDGWAFFFDIDGTLIDIAATPDAVVVPPELPPLLAAVCKGSGGALALVTGRDMATVDGLFSPFRLPVGAVHGALIRGADGAVTGDAPHPALAEVRRHLEAFAAAHPLVLIEDKGTALAVHFRTDPAAEGAARAAVDAAVAAAGPELAVPPGQMVFEVRPAGANKGLALRALMQDDAFEGRRPVAVGDDLTDESMFAAALAAGGLALRVGPPPDSGSIAQSVFATPEDVRRWLAALA
jgi:trehalose 6-phosphate phosphatase